MELNSLYQKLPEIFMSMVTSHSRISRPGLHQCNVFTVTHAVNTNLLHECIVWPTTRFFFLFFVGKLFVHTSTVLLVYIMRVLDFDQLSV